MLLKFVVHPMKKESLEVSLACVSPRLQVYLFWCVESVTL